MIDYDRITSTWYCKLCMRPLSKCTHQRETHWALRVIGYIALALYAFLIAYACAGGRL